MRQSIVVYVTRATENFADELLTCRYGKTVV